MADSDQYKVMVLAVVEGGLGVADAAQRFGVSRQWLHRLVARYRADGLGALEPGSRAPLVSPTRVSDEVRALIIATRDEMVAHGWDAGAESILDRLASTGVVVPSRATIHRILTANQRVAPQPRKRPRSSWIRFEAVAPNSCWQSDMTHWHLADDSGVEIITWLDDHSRFVTHLSAHTVVTAPIVTATFLAAARIHGLPAATLTDNGLIFTTRFAAGKGGPNHFENVIAELGITQKNGHPGHPQTQGKIERFHQTLKRWLAVHPAATLSELNNQLAVFVHGYNTRPHRSLSRRTPTQAYTAIPKDGPRIELLRRHWRVRYDIVDTNGTVTLRWAGKLRHLATGRAHAHHGVVVLVAGTNTIIIRPDTGEIIAEHTLDETRDYHPKKQ